MQIKTVLDFGLSIQTLTKTTMNVHYVNKQIAYLVRYLFIKKSLQFLLNFTYLKVIHEGFKNCKTFQNNVCKTRDPKHDAVRRQWDEIFNDKRVFCCPNCQVISIQIS